MILKTNDLVNEKSDIELYKLFLEGDNEAFNTLIIRHRKKLTNFIKCIKYCSQG